MASELMKKMVFMKKFIFAFVLSILVILFQNCGKPSFESTTPPISPVLLTPAEPLLSIGTVETLPNVCSSGGLTGTSCQTVQVNCPDQPSINAQIRITPPSANTTNRGTIIFGTGGSGVGFLEDSAPAMRNVFMQLANDGYQVIQRSWVSRWEQSGAGMDKAACRYATLMTDIHTRFHTSNTAYCASGNSAGGSEIAYSLAHYGKGELLDFAVISGGPPMARLDLGCLGSLEWTNQCNTIVPANTYIEPLQCGYVADNITLIDSAYSPASPCLNKDESLRSTFLEDSIASPRALLSYPKTKIHFIYGKIDYTIATAIGHMYSTVVTSEKEFTYLPDVPHEVVKTLTGSQAIYEALKKDCILRH